MANNKKYFFGDTEVSKEEKVKKVNEVFDSVAKRYDIMNDKYNIFQKRILLLRLGLWNRRYRVQVIR